MLSFQEIGQQTFANGNKDLKTNRLPLNVDIRGTNPNPLSLIPSQEWDIQAPSLDSSSHPSFATDADDNPIQFFNEIVTAALAVPR